MFPQCIHTIKGKRVWLGYFSDSSYPQCRLVSTWAEGMEHLEFWCLPTGWSRWLLLGREPTWWIRGLANTEWEVLKMGFLEKALKSSTKLGERPASRDEVFAKDYPLIEEALGTWLEGDKGHWDTNTFTVFPHQGGYGISLNLRAVCKCKVVYGAGLYDALKALEEALSDPACKFAPNERARKK